MRAPQRWCRYCLLTVCCGLVTGCAIGNQYRYDDLAADVRVVGHRTVAIATLDQRASVVAGDRTPDFVGVQRGGMGTPFDVTTASGEPLATDMTSTIARSLDVKGFRVVPVSVEPPQSEADVVAQMRLTGASRLVVLELREWNSDTQDYGELTFDLTLRVHDEHGTLLGVQRLHGKDQLGGGPTSGASNAKQAVRDAWVEKLETLFGEPNIQIALAQHS